MRKLDIKNNVLGDLKSHRKITWPRYKATQKTRNVNPEFGPNIF